MARVAGKNGKSGKTVAVILSAGQGTRMGASHNKVFIPLGGVPILVRTIQAFARSRAIDEVVLVAHPLEVDYCAREIVAHYHLGNIVRAVIPGGASRHESEDCALSHLRERIESRAVGIVLIHDGARPFVSPREINALITATRQTGGAILAGPVDEDAVMLFTNDEGHVEHVYVPTELARAHTPQSFEARALLAAYDAARAEGFQGTDTAVSVERAGGRVAVVWSESPNIKITTPDDLVRAEMLLEEP